MPHRYLVADVFTRHAFGGNPLAVFPDGSELDGEAMQTLARELNLSETVFVLPPERGGTCRLRIFTPAAELPFAGHPTVGAAFVLAAIGAIPLDGERTEIVCEEGVGPVPVRIEARDGHPTHCRLTVARPPQSIAGAPDPDAVAGILGLEPGEVHGGAARPEFFSCGVPFLFARLRDVAAVGRARFDRREADRLLGDAPSRNVFLFASSPVDDFDWQARMFAPALGVEEDPATGSAAAALAGWLARQPGQREGSARWRIAQGIEMGRPSSIELSAEVRAREAVAVHVGGTSVLVAEGHFLRP